MNTTRAPIAGSSAMRCKSRRTVLHARKWARVGGWVGGQCAQQPFFEHAKALAEYAHKYLHP